MFGLNIAKAAILLLSVAAIFGSGFYGGYQRADKQTQAVTAQYNRFKGGVEATGREAFKKAERETAAGIQLKKDTDAKDKARAAAGALAIASLRKQLDAKRDSSGGVVPAAPSGSVCPPEWACYERSALEPAVRGLVTEVRGLADESAKVERELGTAREWAREVNR